MLERVYGNTIWVPSLLIPHLIKHVPEDYGLHVLRHRVFSSASDEAGLRPAFAQGLRAETSHVLDESFARA